MSIPQLKLPSTPDGLLAERGRLEGLLDASEDWRALKQLRARAGRGETLTSVSESQLERLLLDNLAQNQFYARHMAVQRELDRFGRDDPTSDPISAPPTVSDDLKRIRRIDANLERRLHDAGVQWFEQIRDWTSQDVRKISAALAIANRISAENWIEQAALLSASRPRPLEASVQAQTSAMPPQTVPDPQGHAASEEEILAKLEPEPTPDPEPVLPPQSEPLEQLEIESSAEPEPKTSETLAVEPPRPFAAAGFALTVASPTHQLDTVDETVEESVPGLARVEAVAMPAPAHDDLDSTGLSEDFVAQSDEDPNPEWMRQQIDALEAQLLDIAYGSDTALSDQPSETHGAAPPSADGQLAIGPETEMVHFTAPLHDAPPPVPAPPPLPAAAIESADDRLSGLLGREDYAAFRTSVAEATVEIVRKNGTNAPPEVPQTLPAAAALPPAYPWPLEEPRDDSTPDGRSGRFTKALTGN